jgi:hypothetical protein
MASSRNYDAEADAAFRYCPRRPDFADVACGFGCGARAVGGLGAALRSGLTPCGVFGLLEKFGM